MLNHRSAAGNGARTYRLLPYPAAPDELWLRSLSHWLPVQQKALSGGEQPLQVLSACLPPACEKRGSNLATGQPSRTDQPGPLLHPCRRQLHILLPENRQRSRPSLRGWSGSGEMRAQMHIRQILLACLFARGAPARRQIGGCALLTRWIRAGRLL